MTAGWGPQLIAGLAAAVFTAVLLVRFCKRQLAAFHRVFTNHLLRPLAARMPGFGIVINVGRRTGTVYHTPVNVFRRTDRFLIALTYGKDSGWVKNVLAAGRCQIQTRRFYYQVTRPVVVFDPACSNFPLFVRVVLWLVDAKHYLQLSTVNDPVA